MAKILGYDDKIGVLDPSGTKFNPLTNSEYSDDYKSLGKIWSTYPVYYKAKEILESLKKNQLTFAVVGTGGGKTALMPKFALHYTNYQGKIGITLPKRNATLTAASFAAKTLDVKLGDEIGYVYKGSSREMANSKNKLLYMTDGLLIMKFINDPLLEEFNVLIIDEAHERKVQIDLILLFIKNLLMSGKRPDLKVIIMSATIDSEKYKKYFSGVTSNVINISGQSNYPIETHFLKNPSKSYMIEGLELIRDIVKGRVLDKPTPMGDILFFITTSKEALQLCKEIRPEFPRVYCIELYADMDPKLKIFAETKESFMELGDYDQKMIMATNVAESSITIDGLKYVIDSGYELYSYFDPIFNGNVLEKRLITQAQALQRRGRVGRTEPGICYHLLTEEQFYKLEKYPEPDILKQDITIDILKMMQISKDKTFKEATTMLSQLMDTPNKPYVTYSYNLLKLYSLIDDSDKLTNEGNVITGYSSLPINRTIFMIYAYKLMCAREASIIVAMFSILDSKLSNLFFKINGKVDISKAAIANFVQKKGDHLTFLKIYTEFRKTSDQKKWAKQYGIRLDLLNKVTETANMYYYKLINFLKNPIEAKIELSRIIDGYNDRNDNKPNIKKNITEALKLSHLHLTAKGYKPLYPEKDFECQINRDSVIHYSYKKKDLLTKKFIYDELIQINGTWEFVGITLL